ncbi:hypothetical protein U1763_17415 [Sphingomonas sp. LB2R24]|uniref:hypothetical protein n=1 Tax=Sphingomonas sorbitolis TaxID=3096165 RepID=UPI002FCAFCA5
MSAPSDTVSIREFARIDGCSDKLVRRAISEGKLRVSADGKLDRALAGTGWRRTNRRAAEGADTVQMSAPSVRTSKRGTKVSAPEDPAPDPLRLDDEDFIAEVLAGRFALTGEAERVKENGLAARSLLAARREAGDVVDLEVAETLLFNMARSVRDAWLNWPSRVSPLIAASLGISVEPLLEALNDHVQQHLASLGEPEADFANAE